LVGCGAQEQHRADIAQQLIDVSAELSWLVRSGRDRAESEGGEVKRVGNQPIISSLYSTKIIAATATTMHSSHFLKAVESMT
jgi:hypothetical protein